MLKRFDASASSGVVRWPTGLESDGGGGMYVWALVGLDDEDRDNFSVCLPTYAGLLADTLVDPDPEAGDIGRDGFQMWPLQERWFPGLYQDNPWSKELLAAVLLGTSGGCWRNADGSSWTCQRTDLEPAGEALVAGLEGLYGQPVTLLTFLDT